jgi:hypothetical protein
MVARIAVTNRGSIAGTASLVAGSVAANMTTPTKPCALPSCCLYNYRLKKTRDGWASYCLRLPKASRQSPETNAQTMLAASRMAQPA